LVVDGLLKEVLVKYMKLIFALIMFSSQILAAPMAWAEPEQKPEKLTGMPIDMDMDFWKTLHFSVGGYQLNGDKELGEVIYPLNDKVATERLKSVGGQETLCLVFLITAIGMYTGAVADLSSKLKDSGALNYTGESANYTGDYFLFGGGLASTVLALLFRNMADVNRFEAVQRYNRIVRNETRISFRYSPENKMLGLSVGQPF
jgi:hypothetical protein